MAEALNPDGTPVTVGGVTLSTPGLAGQVEVLTAGTPGLRTREGSADAFAGAVASAGFLEQLTVEISEHTELAQVAGSRSGGGPEITLSIPSPGHSFAQVLLYTAEDGSQSWHLPSEPPGTSVQNLTYSIPRAIVPAPAATGPTYRGLVWALGRKILKVLAFPLLERGTAVVAERLAARWEAEHRPYLVRAFTPDDYAHEGRGLDAEDWARLAQGPALLFLHGTFSRSDLAFGELPPERFRALHDLYAGRVLAFDHPTLSVDPAANARELRARLPEGLALTVDVIAHSRGGLVGRELAGPPEPGLSGLSGLSVRRLVMVGTPNAGTILADSKHWGALVDRMTNLLQFVPGSPVTDVLDAVLTVLKHLALGAVQGLDGLTAMDPAGDYLEKLKVRTPEGKVPLLFAVASDYDPPAHSPLSRVSRNDLTDLVFGRDGNDLVVPTLGTYQLEGAPGFPVPGPLILEKTAGVEHTAYFDHPAVAEQLLTWLS